MTFPPIPTWQAVHPLIVHFPIALLLIAPLLVVMGAVQKPGRGDRILLASLILMALGTISIFMAASGGEASRELVEGVPQAKAILDQHQELAETTEIAFSALTLIFASIIFVPKILKRNRSRILSTVLPLVFLLLYATGVVLLANTAHQGALLVYELGIKAPIHPSSVGSAETA